MANIFELVGMIAVENGDANKAIDETSSKARAFASSMKKGIQDAAKWGAGIATAAAAATVAITNEIKKLVSNAASAADTIDKASDRIGFSTQAYQEWDYVLNLCGTSAETLESGMKALQEKMYGVKNGSDEAIRIFDDLGISCYALNGEMKDAEVIFEEVIYKLAEMSNESERTQLAQKAFSEGGVKLANMLNQGTAGIDAMRESFRELGIEMSEEDIAAGVVYTDTAYMLKRAVDSIKNDFGMTVMPYLTDLANGLLEKIPAIKEKLAEWEPTIQATLDKIFDGLNWIIDNPEKVGDALTAIGGFFGVLYAATHPVQASIIAIGAGIIGLVNAFKGGNTETDKFSDKLGDIDENMLNTIRAIEEENLEINTLLDTIDALAGNTKMTADESERWEAAVNRLDELLPGFKDSVDEETKSIEEGTTAYRERAEALKDAAIEEAKQKALQDKYNAVAEAYAATGKLQLDIETNQALLPGRKAAYEAADAAYEEWYRENGHKAYTGERRKEGQRLLDARNDAFLAYSATVENIENARDDLETLIPAIEEAEEYLSAMEAALEGGAEGLENTLTGATEALNGAKAAIENIGVLPALAESAENNLQEDLNDMDLTVSVDPVVSGSGFFGSFASGDFYRNKVNEALNGIPGHAEGLDYVPYDNYVARLHKGEKVLTANEASAYRSGEGNARVEAAVNRLGEILHQVLSAIKEGQVMQLDTGVLVGATAGAMNNQLGVLAARSGRRN